VTKGHSNRHAHFVSQIVVVCFGSKRRPSGPDFLASIDGPIHPPATPAWREGVRTRRRLSILTSLAGRAWGFRRPRYSRPHGAVLLAPAGLAGRSPQPSPFLG